MDGGAMGGMPGMGLNLNNLGTTLDYLNTNGHAQFLPNAQVNIKDMVGGNQSYLVFGGLQNLEEDHEDREEREERERDILNLEEDNEREEHERDLLNLEEDNEHEERERDLMMLREEREREGDL